MLFHGGVNLVSLVLVVVSSILAYPFSDLLTMILLAVGVIALDALMAFVVKKDGVIRDLCMLLTVGLTSWLLCRVAAGRADLMGYVWFSDLEAGNPVAVTSLYLATAGLVLLVGAVLLNVVWGFQKNK